MVGRNDSATMTSYVNVILTTRVAALVSGDAQSVNNSLNLVVFGFLISWFYMVIRPHTFHSIRAA